MTKVHWFGDNVDRYDSWFERNRLAYESEMEAVRALVQPSGKGLEIGVGTGRFAAPLGIRFGIEPSYEMGKYAVRRGIEVVLGVGEDLPCKENSLDMVLMVTTICFLDDVSAAIKEAYRVITGEGCIVIGFVDRHSALGRFYEKYKEENVFYRPATFLSVDDVLSYLRQAGFRDFLFRQTMFGKPSEMKISDPVKEGYGKGSFVVVRGRKPRLRNTESP